MRKLPRSWNVSDVEHDGQLGTNPQSRQSTNFAKPRWLSSSTALCPAESSPRSASVSCFENIDLDPPLNSAAMSTTVTSGIGRPFARSGSLTCVHFGSLAAA